MSESKPAEPLQQTEPEPKIDEGNPTKVTAAAHKEEPAATHHGKRRPMIMVIGMLVVIALAILGVPRFLKSLGTISTDDAYINGHVTFVAPRVAGQVARVLVDDNNRVHKGDLLVQLDKEPFEVEVNISQAALGSAQADLASARAEARALVGQARGARFNLEHAIEDVDNQAALLRSKVATLESKKASLAKAQADYDRNAPLVKSGALASGELDKFTEALSVARAQVNEALEGVYQVRAALGIPAKPESADDLSKVPPDLDQTASQVRQAQASLMQAASQLGVADTFDKPPRQMVADFYKRDPEGNIDRIYEELLKGAPIVKKAESKVVQAQRNLEQAQLNLRYCDVLAEIDGVVTRRAVNPGNNVVVGQGVMAVRSLTEIWIDANFKETQLANLRIGQPVDVEVDMYGKRQKFKGRVSGFTMGTGSTLALLPAENATGNFVKVVQRLPVRIDLLDYDPDKIPLFIGLSVNPHVHVKEQATGPDAGLILQPHSPNSNPTARPETKP